MGRVAENIVASVLHSAVRRSGVGNHQGVTVLGEQLAFSRVVKGFDPLDMLLPSRIVMHTHEDGVAIAVGDSSSLGKGNESVVASNHDRAVALTLEIILDAHGGIESEVLLVDFTRMTPDIFAPVSGVDDDYVLALRTLRRGR